LLSVNRRPIRSRSLAYAVEEGYATLLQVGRHPVALVDLEVPAAEVDVNVHPTKAEVRLLRERLIYGGLRDSVRAVLADSAWGKSLSDPPKTAGTGQLPGADSPRLLEVPLATPAGGAEATAGGRRLPILRLMGQIAQTYIVAEGEHGLYLVDQHAAHERVLLERLKRSMGQEGNTQLLLEPLTLSLTPQQWEVIHSAGSCLESMGYLVEPFGDRSLLVRGVPSQLPGPRAMPALEESLQELAEEKPPTEWQERLAIALSCRGAVKAGQTLTTEEMRSLLESLEETDITQNCSHGRPTAILISHNRLEKEFGRR
jgi:DNA mismatch repair protein MutL